MSERSEHLVQLRRADSRAKAARLLGVLEVMTAGGEMPNIAQLARRTGVSRRFVYDHPELRAEIDRRAAEVADRHSSATATSVRVTTASLRADLENTKARNHRVERDLAALRLRLGEVLGHEVLAETSGGHSEGTRAAEARVAELEQVLTETNDELVRRTDDLEAARQINRELMGRLNRHH